ncbi:MAG TPA: hypothetical protein VIZ18_05440 [Ktedonobacteraceae bacterium]
MLGQTSYTHDGVLNYARRLPHAEQLKLLEELAAMIRQQQVKEPEEPLHSLLELEGLGAELWEGIDPQKYIEEERKSLPK